MSAIFSQGDLQQLSFIPNPEAAYELCNSYVPDCDKPLPRDEDEIRQEQQQDQQAGYRGMSEDELLNREGVTPQEYLEFTERVEEIPPPAPEEPEDQFNYFSIAGEPGLRGEPGVRSVLNAYFFIELFPSVHFLNLRSLVPEAHQVQRETLEGMALME